MEKFQNLYQKNLTGIISVFDRIILKGYLPMCYPQAAEAFLKKHDVLLKEFKEFTTQQTEKIKAHAIAIAHKAQRPYEYIRENLRKEEYARSIATRDNIKEGLICVLARNEENLSFGLRRGNGQPHLVKNSPQCLTLYFYYLDKHFGFMHVRLSTWMPFTIQVYINGHEWLAREMSAHDMVYEQWENTFTIIKDCAKAQQVADKLLTIPWEKILHAFASRVNPLFKTILKGMEYYWVIDQAEFATDVMVSDEQWLSELYVKWQKHAAVCFQAEDIMRFMGRKLHGRFNQEIVTNVKARTSVTRIKHTVRGNWIKMYNKHRIVLRVETVINRPQEFRIFKLDRGEKGGHFEALRKRITNMAHYARLCLRCNYAYLDALAAVGDPTDAYRQLRDICEPVGKQNKRVRALNPLRENDRALFEAVVRGEHHLHGFKAQEIGKLLGIEYSNDQKERNRQCAKINRKLRLLRGHGLITKHGRSRRYRVTEIGMKYMNAAILLHSEDLPLLLKKAA
jgi:hypothetical protein